MARTGLYRMAFEGMREWAERARTTAEAKQAAVSARRAAASVRLPLAEAMSQRAAAAVALCRGTAGIAADRVLASMAAAEEIGARVDASTARTLAGRALAAGSEHEQAIGELELAARRLDACGAVRYRDQAEHELRRLGRHPYRRTRPHNADGVGVETLTKRETEIAHLVKNRDTNDVTSRVEVARTVERAEAPRRSQTEPDG